MEQDHYAVLGVAPAAEQAAIRVAYRSLVRRYHPDAGASAETAERARAINLTYAILGDPEKRSHYDGLLEPRRALRQSAEPSALPNQNAAPVVAISDLSKPASIQPASATSPCLAAVRRTDRLMCDDRNLASLDRQVKLLYRQSYSGADESKRAVLVGTRQRFNDRRDTCETSNCLKTAYVLRLKEISDIMAGRVQP